MGDRYTVIFSTESDDVVEMSVGPISDCKVKVTDSETIAPGPMIITMIPDLNNAKFMYWIFCSSIMLLINESEVFSSTLYNEYKLNLNWIALHYENLLLYYENKYVAVEDKNVVDSDHNLQKLLKRIESDRNYVWKMMAILHVNRKRKSF